MNRTGRSGGLAILWRQLFDCAVLSYSLNFINVVVSTARGPNWRFIGFYGYPDSGKRRDSWDLLRTLS